MRISIGQIIILLVISFLLFGDIQNLKHKFEGLIKKIKEFLKK
uniref:Sec-independent protein translocase component tatA/E n=1 Tax=Pseudo-nitzschia micropora TaxID=186175 RepID=A0A888YLS0_9STRA|nr:Sec-independent protein translocase component tatA/E [Pseudo-nitzschia micropora]QRC76533.1 Sec-independent protein translocase component tatA/E [Pseudo-nitzschia micropora]